MADIEKLLAKIQKQLYSLLLIWLLLVFGLIVAEIVVDWGTSLPTLSFNEMIIGVTSVVVFFATLALLSIEYSNALDKKYKDKKSKSLLAGKRFFQSAIFFVISVLFFAAIKYISRPAPTFIPDFVFVTGLIATIIAAVVAIVVTIVTFVSGLLDILDVLRKD